MEKSTAIDLTSVEALADSAPVRKLLNMVLLLAIKDRWDASDLHFEPFENEFKIRIRSDGVLYEMVPPPRHLAFAITTRIKVMADLDIAERRLPQDGRIRLTVGGHPVDLRVSVLPTMFGESVVMRILDRSVVMLDLDAVGMPDGILAVVPRGDPQAQRHRAGHRPDRLGQDHHALRRLNELNDIEDKLITTEDPVEYDIDGIMQMPIDAAIGNTFAQCLRSILRQDPDKILVGEIRDLETAEIAVQASLTGHMVFSTLHTNDAPSTVTRLRDMGVPPFLITATLEAILAQRLVRKICTRVPRADHAQHRDCWPSWTSRPTTWSARSSIAAAAAPPATTPASRAAPAFRVHADQRPAPRPDQPRRLDRAASRPGPADGMVPLRDSGLEKVFDGMTTIEEVIRETVAEG